MLLRAAWSPLVNLKRNVLFWILGFFTKNIISVKTESGSYKRDRINKPIWSSNAEAEMNCLHPRRSREPDGFEAKSQQTFKKALMAILLKLFYMEEREGTFPNAFRETRVIGEMLASWI